jgi:outer membrane protein OmpA-like peptidoglycan-associated protein
MATRTKMMTIVMALVAWGVPSVAFGQGTETKDAEPLGEKAVEKTTDAAEDASEDEAEAEADAEADAEAEKKGKKKKEKEKESKDGDYEFKLAYGGGLEVGAFFNGLERWNAQILEETGLPTFDTDASLNLDLALEVYPVESLRLSLFGGIQGPLSGSPAPWARAVYVGIEPAFAARRGPWEVALGVGAGVGGLNVGVEDTGEISAGLVMLRPFVEVRNYLNDSLGVYGRFGFNYWATHSLDVEGFEESTRFQIDELFSSNLNEGGFYVALGVRFGNYPEPIAVVGDEDDDGIKDDIDDCPAEAEDFDEFEDKDGCPDDDNDGDGVLDSADACPDEKEDADGWKDEDGCPEDDDDTDGDGILNKDDKCPDEKEDFDAYQDADGCPEPDNDGDGVLDVDDKCPLVPGVKENRGCKYRRITLLATKIQINEKVFFELGKAEIKPESFPLLDELAKLMVDTPRIKKVEVQGHTDSAGKDTANLKLSDARANSVRDYLIGKGVEAERLVAKGYGESTPIAPPAEGEDETPEQAAQNRRVEFIILEQDAAKKVIREDKLEKEGAPKGFEVAPK